MGRNHIDLLPHKDFILSAHAAKDTSESIRKSLKSCFDLDVSRTTLWRFLKDHNAPSTRGPRTNTTEALENEIYRIYFETTANDHEALELLRSKSFEVSFRGLQAVRRKLGILRRHAPEDIENKLKKVRNIFEQVQRDNSAHFVRRMGRRELQFHFREQHQLFIPREPLYACFKTFFPEAVKEKIDLLKRRKGGWTVPGPNYTWCMDAHLKLGHWGIETYAAIDAYSRYVPWFYTGISGTTQRSVFAQWVKVVGERGFIPYQLRSDCGNEVNMVATGMYYLALGTQSQRILKPKRISPEHVAVFEDGPPGEDVIIRHDVVRKDQQLPTWSEEMEMLLTDIFVRGKSTQNQRIESWWKQLREGRGLFWSDYFGRLEGMDLWRKGKIEDHIALLYIFMPQIRSEFESFLKYWNQHTIRNQHQRRHVVTGKPVDMYYDYDETSALDCRVEMHWERYQHLKDISEADSFDLDRYLPQDMMDLCAQLMEDFQPYAVNSVDSPFRMEYEHLRAKLEEHNRTLREPCLGLYDSPTGGFDELKELIRQAGGNIDGMMEAL